MEEIPESFTGKILFVCSGNSHGRCTAAIEEQARVLKGYGAEIHFFRIEGKGLMSYLSAIGKLRHYVDEHSFDLVHAHYGLSGMVARLSGAHPLVVSLMGSDVFGAWWLRLGVRIFTKFFWPLTIVKSEEMAAKVGVRKVKIIPNGVDMELFREMPKTEARQELEMGLNSSFVVLWPANPAREVKNASLAQTAMERVEHSPCELKMVFDRPTEMMPLYYNAADVVLLTSKWEGSPNVVKEALACNTPVVSTPVGDVKKWLKKLEGCAICAPEPGEIAAGIDKALNHKGRINGRERIKELDNRNIIKRLFSVYAEVMNSPSQGIR